MEMEKIMRNYKFFVKLKINAKNFVCCLFRDVVFIRRQTKLLCIWTDW